MGGALTPADRELLAFALEAGVDGLSVSFVETPEELHAARREAQALGYAPFLVAKIERARAWKHIDAIIAAADGIMVARGDLGVEVPIGQIALIQKRLIRKASAAGKPVITATQMLESMIHNRRPTRAEVTDVANAILDGTDCVMLSEESAMGDYPVDAVKMLAEIARITEKSRSELSHHTHHHTCQRLCFYYGVHAVAMPSPDQGWGQAVRRWLVTQAVEKGLILLTQGPIRGTPVAPTVSAWTAPRTKVGWAPMPCSAFPWPVPVLPLITAICPSMPIWAAPVPPVCPSPASMCSMVACMPTGNAPTSRNACWYPTVPAISVKPCAGGRKSTMPCNLFCWENISRLASVVKAGRAQE